MKTLDSSAGRRIRVQPSIRQRSLLGVAWFAALVVTIVALQALGHGELSTPPLHSLQAFRTWVDERTAITAAFAVLRLLALVAAWYAIVASGFGVFARLAGRPGLIRLTDIVTVRSVRRLVGGIVGLSFTATTAVGLAGATVPARPSALTTVESRAWPAETSSGRSWFGEGSPGTEAEDPSLAPVPLPPPSSSPGTATMHVLEDGSPSSAAPHSRTARAGDHLWRLAEQRLAEELGRAPTDAEVAPYWTAVVEHNRPRLVDPANPDLIFVGQVFELPPPTPPPD